MSIDLTNTCRLSLLINRSLFDLLIRGITNYVLIGLQNQKYGFDDNIMRILPELLKVIMMMCTEMSIMKLLSCCKTFYKIENVPSELNICYREDISAFIKDCTYKISHCQHYNYDGVSTNVTYIAYRMFDQTFDNLHLNVNLTSLEYGLRIKHDSYTIVEVKNAKSCDMLLNGKGEVLINLEYETHRRKGDHKDLHELTEHINCYIKMLGEIDTVVNWSLTKNHSYVKMYSGFCDLIVFTTPFVYHIKQ